ncbi:hypothetical protein [Paenibacillus validus]|uniref:hypothetical protein n=1 Tax=Paenibacillus validus TaxID=44253 RepID=UPI003D2924EC
MNRYRRIAQQVIIKEEPAKQEASAAAAQVAAAGSAAAAPKKKLFGRGKKADVPEIDFMDQLDGELAGLPDPAGKKKEKPVREPRERRKPLNPFLGIKWLFDTLFRLINWISNTVLSLFDSLQGILISVVVTVLAMIALKHYGYTDIDILAWIQELIAKFKKN